jgi:hypothetical protein
MFPAFEPRTRGDIPSPSPPTRPVESHPGLAGMFPSSTAASTRPEPVPRQPQGCSLSVLNTVQYWRCSLASRGCSLLYVEVAAGEELLPAPVGDVPDGEARLSLREGCFPHPRECSLGDSQPQQQGSLFPASAGMFSGSRRPSAATRSAPRVCWGDGLLRLPGPLFLASAGMFRRLQTGLRTWLTASRVRGDVPDGQTYRNRAQACSLHARGCSGMRGVTHHLTVVLPTPAGMVPRRTTSSTR